MDTKELSSRATPELHYDVMGDNQLIYLAVVGFHHSKGYQIEFCYPCMRDADKSWMSSYLAPIGLPDGAHNFASDTVCFRFRNSDRNAIWGVCSYKQVDSASYKETDPEVTRSAIQKSVCIIGQNRPDFTPAWRTIAVKLEPIAHAYIQHQDTAILEGVYESLCQVVGYVNDLLLEMRSVLIKYDVQLITLLKLRLLQRKVLFLSSDQPVHEMCSEILALEAATPFGEMCFPYITLSMMEDPVVTTAQSFVGASNRLYKQKWRDQFDVLVENGTLSFADKALERVIGTTQADLRFADWLQRTCRQSRCRWEGSEEWLRTQLNSYFCGLRLLVQEDNAPSGVNEKLLAAYGTAFVTEVKKKDEVIRWLKSCVEDESKPDGHVESGHPGSGQLSLQDVKLRLVHHAKGLMAHFHNL